jgi:ribonuclease T
MKPIPVAKRFRGFLPVVVDVETAGFNADTDALLEVAAVILTINERGEWDIDSQHIHHVAPFKGANINQSALEFTGIDPFHPFRLAVSETEAFKQLFEVIQAAVKQHNCTRAVLVGHNAAFDLNFWNATVKRNKLKGNPFHQFSSFDTASLAGLAYGQTVLAKAVKAADLSWDSKQAHSALYDAERTAALFCKIVNRWNAAFAQQLTQTIN